MRANVKAVYLITDDGVVYLDSWGYDHTGPWELAKKGKNQKRVAGEQEAYGKKEEGIQDQYRADADPFMKSLISTQPGQMSPYAAAQYGSDVENISRTYNNLRQAGFKALGARGFGNAPAGMESSMLNTANNAQGNAITGAYRAGLDRTLGEGLEASNYFQKGESLYNPDAARAGATKSYDSADAGAAQSWKTGIGIASGIAGAFVPGVGLLGGLNKLGQKSGGSTYGSATPTFGGDFSQVA